MNAQNRFGAAGAVASGSVVGFRGPRRRTELRRALRWTRIALLAFPALIAAGQERAIDTGASVLTVRVFRAGVLGGFGHDHQIVVPIASGFVNVGAQRVELRARAAAMKVRDPGASDRDLMEIQKTMLGPQVLDAERYPEIEFRATSAEVRGPQAWSVRGELTLHGETHPIMVEVRQEGGRYTGLSRFKQSEFGIKPIKLAGGTVKVKDEVRVEFDIRLRQ